MATLQIVKDELLFLRIRICLELSRLECTAIPMNHKNWDVTFLDMYQPLIFLTLGHNKLQFPQGFSFSVTWELISFVGYHQNYN